jgi:hypothetical protein
VEISIAIDVPLDGIEIGRASTDRASRSMTQEEKSTRAASSPHRQELTARIEADATVLGLSC